MKEVFEVDLRGSEGSTVKSILEYSEHKVIISDEEYIMEFFITIEYQNGSVVKHSWKNRFIKCIEHSCLGDGSDVYWRMCGTVS